MATGGLKGDMFSGTK